MVLFPEESPGYFLVEASYGSRRWIFAVILSLFQARKRRLREVKRLAKITQLVTGKVKTESSSLFPELYAYL